MKRKRFSNISVGTTFLWDKSQKSLHIKISEERAVILDNKSSYHIGAVVVMADKCLVVVVNMPDIEKVNTVYNRLKNTNIHTTIGDMQDTWEMLK